MYMYNGRMGNGGGLQTINVIKVCMMHNNMNFWRWAIGKLKQPLPIRSAFSRIKCGIQDYTIILSYPYIEASVFNVEVDWKGWK